MKNRIILGIFALTLLVTIGFGVNKSMQSDTELSAIALANVEALAQNEDGTNVGYCYEERPFSSNLGWKIFCDSRTDDNKIYPCSSTE